MKVYFKSILLICAILFYLKLSSQNEEMKPNIIIILTDDMGYSDLSVNGGPYSTPHLDSLAKEGKRFTKYYSAAPICSPSRAALLTGMEPSKWNIYTFEQEMAGNRAADQAPYLDPVAPSIARVLKEKAGYNTAHFGKWHLGGGRDVYYAPPFSAYGYDEHSSTYESPDPDPLLTATDWIWSPKDSIKRWNRTAYWVDKTLDFLKRHKGEPNFVNLWPDDMHTPWVPNAKKQDQKDTYENEESFRMVLEEYDRQIGRLIDGIDDLGLSENTLIIFTSDNGPLPSFNGRRTGSKRGSKLSLYEGGIAMPFIIRWPGQVNANEVDSTSVISNLDIFPTLAAITGVAMPSRFSFDGESRKDVWLKQPGEKEKIMFWDYGSHGKKEVYRYPEGRDRSPNLAIREGKWKLLINYDGSQAELYDVEEDPEETNNVLTTNKKRAERLKQKLIKWRNNVPKTKHERFRN